MLREYKKIIDRRLKESIPSLSSPNPLRDVCEYALTNGGKRLRPIIVLMMGKALGTSLDLWELAMGIECFHSASLVADDLPCMDDDDMRRGKASTHKAKGESQALLASYALIARAYASLHNFVFSLSEQERESFSLSPEKLCLLALENATINTGLSGATGGQFLDLHASGTSAKDLQTLIHQKTVTLFEIAFVWGWLFGGGDPALLEKVKACAWHFGLSFQIADDLDDEEEDLLREGKSFSLQEGRKKSLERLKKELSSFEKSFSDLKVDNKEFLVLSQSLRKKHLA